MKETEEIFHNFWGSINRKSHHSLGRSSVSVKYPQKIKKINKKTIPIFVAVAVAIVGIVVFRFLTLTTSAAGTTKYAINAGGTWSTNGTWSTISAKDASRVANTTAPTAEDTVILDDYSGSVSISNSSTVYARSVNCTGYAATLTHGSSATLTIGDATAGDGNAALTLSATMNYTLTSATTSAISFVSTNATAQTITWAGKTPGNLTFNGTGATWQFEDGLSAPLTTLTLTTGTINTNAQSVSISCLMSNGGATTRGLNITNSTITVAGSGNYSWNVGSAPSGLSLTTTGSTINCTGSGATFWSGSKTYNIVNFTGGGTTTLGGTASADTFGTLSVTGTASKTDVLSLPMTGETITGTLTLQGNSATNRLLVRSSAIGTARTLTAAAVDIDNVDFMDITAAGAAFPFTGVSLGDCGGNTYITTDTPVAQTWSGTGGGNWSDNAWSGRVPLPQDDVNFSTINAGQTITVNMPRMGKNISFAGATNTVTVVMNSVDNSVGYSVFGSLNFSRVSTLTSSRFVFFRGRSNGSLISNGGYLDSVYIQMPGAEFTFEDAFQQLGSDLLNVTNGTLNVESTVDTYRLTTSTGTTVNMGNNTWIAHGATTTWQVANATINAEGSTIAFTGTSGTQSCSMGANTYNNITITPSSYDLTFSGSFTFANMTMSSAGTKTVRFNDTNDYVMTGDNFLNGTSGNLVTIDSDDGTNSFDLTKSSGIIIGDYLATGRMRVAGGATWYLTVNSTPTPDPNTNGNSGFTVNGVKTISPAGGNWSATTTWNEGVAPVAGDRVFALANSGNLAVNVATADLTTIDLQLYTGVLSGSSNITVVNSSSDEYVKINAGTFSWAGTLLINPASSRTAYLKSNLKAHNLTVNGAGTVKIIENTDLTNKLLTITNGYFDTNNYNLTVGRITMNTGADGFAHSSSSTVTLTTASTRATTLRTTYQPGAGAIIINSGGTPISAANVAFQTLNITAPGDVMINIGSAVNFSRIGTAATTDSLTINANAIITDTLTLAGNSATNRLLVQSGTLGTPVTLTASNLVASNLDLMDITGAGTADWNLSSIEGGSGDCLGNSNITFTDSATQTWDGTTGNWSDNAKWTSRAPLPQDDVVLAGTNTVTADMPRLGKSISFSAATPLTVSTTVSSYGSINFTNAGTFTPGGQLWYLRGRTSGLTITSNNKSFYRLYIYAPGGTYTLQDALVIDYDILVYCGSFVSAGNPITYSRGFDSSNSNTRTVNLAGSTVTQTNATGAYYWNFGTATNLTFTAPATLYLSYTDATATQFACGNLTYNDIQIAPGSGTTTFSGAFTFANMTMSSAGTKTVKFTNSTTYTMTGTNFLSGTAGNVVTVSSDSAGSAFTLSRSSGTAVSNYLSLQDSTVTGGKWYAANSTSVSGNSGWLFGPKSPSYVSASPSGYSRTNSFTFSWPTAGSDAALYHNKYQYRLSPTGTWTDVAGGSGASSITPTSPAYQTGSNVFYLRAVDVSNNPDPSPPQTTFYYNADAPSAPVNLTATPTSATTNVFAFSWTQPVTFSGSIAGYYYSVNTLPTISNASYTTSTSLAEDAYATQQGVNTLYVLAKDEAGNVSFDSCATITGNTDTDSCSKVEFTANTTAPGIPTSFSLTDGSNRETQEFQIFLVWDAPSNQGIDFEGYEIYRSTNNSDFSKIGTTASTSYSDTGLQSVLYYYYVKSVDSAGNSSAKSTTVSLTPTGRYTSPPTLTDGPATSVSVFSATFTWDTDREATSVVKFGKTSDNLSNEASRATEYVTKHTVEVKGLDPETTYYCQLLWVDEDENQGTSSIFSIVTGERPKIENVKTTNITLDSATVSWLTTNAATTSIEYGGTVSYGSSLSEESNSRTTNHSLQLSGLKDSSKYHFRLSGTDADGNELISDDYTFETLTRPIVTDLTFEQVEDAPTTTLKFHFKTNVATTTIVDYQVDGGRSKSQSNSDYLTDHEMIIKDLADAATYTFLARGVDKYGNTAQSETKTFKTSDDTRAPKVKNLVIEVKSSDYLDSQKTQLIASWETDELSTSWVEYGLGISSNQYANKSTEDSLLVYNHVVIVGELEANKIYHVRVGSKDEAGNAGYGSDTTVITGKIQRSIIDIILDAMEKSLGWLFGLTFGGR